MTVDLATLRRLELQPVAVCRCPYCGREVHEFQRLRYPDGVARAFAPVYRCGCGKHIGAPVASYAGVSLRSP